MVFFSAYSDFGSASFPRTPVPQDQQDPILHWGVRRFVFNHTDFLQVMNYAGKLTLCLRAPAEGDPQDLVRQIGACLQELYRDDPEMTVLVQQYMDTCAAPVFASMVNRTIMKNMQVSYTYGFWEGFRLSAFTRGGVLNLSAMNHTINTRPLIGTFYPGTREYVIPKDYFAEVLRQQSPALVPTAGQTGNW